MNEENISLVELARLFFNHRHRRYDQSKELPNEKEYAGISCNDVATTLTIASSGQSNKVQVTAFDTNDPSRLATPSHTTDDITVANPGKYLVLCSAAVESAAGGGADDFGFSIYKNNGATEFPNLSTHRKLAGGGGDKASISMSGIVTLAKGDTIELWCWNENSTDDLVIDSATLSIIKID